MNFRNIHKTQDKMDTNMIKSVWSLTLNNKVRKKWKVEPVITQCHLNMRSKSHRPPISAYSAFMNSFSLCTRNSISSDHASSTEMCDQEGQPFPKHRGYQAC